MKEKDLHKLIREKSSGDNTKLVNALRDKHPELAVKPSEKSSDRERNKKITARRRAVVFARLATVAVLVAVFLPVALTRTALFPDDTGGHDQKPPPLPPQAGDEVDPPQNYSATKIGYTVKEYNERNNTEILYFGWDNIEQNVYEYTHNDTGEFLGLDVIFTVASGELIEYVACPENSDLDYVKSFEHVCVNEETVSGQTVNWGSDGTICFGTFDYQGYDYYIRNFRNSDKSRLFELIEELLLSQEKRGGYAKDIQDL